MTTVPALEIGGSHVTAALIDPATGLVHRRARRDLHGDAPAEVLLDTIAEAAREIGAEPGAVWGAGIPGPFDYNTGIGRFTGVAKFATLNGVHVGTELRDRITPRPLAIRFLNDAAAFGLGEWTGGAARGHLRAVGVTLGTGVGSAFLHAGRTVTAGDAVPPQGRLDLLTINGRPLEETASTRAVLAAYYRTGGQECAGVADVVTRALDGDHRATAIVERAYYLLGTALAPWLKRFAATVLVLGGGISAAWTHVSIPLQQGIADQNAGSANDIILARSADTETAALHGVAVHASAAWSSHTR
jgi:glucokinase